MSIFVAPGPRGLGADPRSALTS